MLLWKRSFLFEQFLESATVAKLIDEVEVISSLEHIEVLDNVRTGLQIRQDVDFVVSALLELGVLLELLSFDHLHGYFLLVLDVDGLVDGGVHASSYLALQRVVLDHLPHRI